MLKQLSLVVSLSLFAVAVHAGDWPQWRGPQFNGSSEEKGLPTKWSTTENIAWATADLPGTAASTPVIFGQHVLLSGVNAAKDTLQAMAFDRGSGKLLWQHDVGQGIRRDDRSNYAASSPVTDGKNAIFFFASGELVCFDLQGQRRWARNIQKDYGTFAFLWTFSSSPLLWQGKLYLQVLQRDVAVDGRGFRDRENESYLLALDPDTGKTLWRQVRPSSAVAESRESFTTPMPLQLAGQSQILVLGGDVLTGHDPETGKELWRWGDLEPAADRPLAVGDIAGGRCRDHFGLRPQTRSHLCDQSRRPRSAGRQRGGVGQPRGQGIIGRRADARILRWRFFRP